MTIHGCQQSRIVYCQPTYFPINDTVVGVRPGDLVSTPDIRTEVTLEGWSRYGSHVYRRLWSAELPDTCEREVTVGMGVGKDVDFLQTGGRQWGYRNYSHRS